MRVYVGSTHMIYLCWGLAFYYPHRPAMNEAWYYPHRHTHAMGVYVPVVCCRYITCTTHIDTHTSILPASFMKRGWM